MKNLMFFLLVLIFVVACKNKDSQFVIADLSHSISTPKVAEILYSFDDAYPVSVAVKDSLIYIIKIKTDTCMSVLNKNTRKILCNFGLVGLGPNDVIRPDFISTVDSSYVLIEDVSVKKFMTIEYNTDTACILKKYIDYPSKIFPSGETNISKNFIVGRQIGKGKMLYIYNRLIDSMIEIDYYPIIKGIKHDRNYVFAPTLVLNENKNRIIVGMYLFDMFHVFDLYGKRLKTVTFSNYELPKFDSKDLMADIQKSSAGIIRSFATKNYCYLLRIVGDRITNNLQNMIVKLDWDGNLIEVYEIKDKIEGQFYVDEQNKKMYVIRHRIVQESTVSEIFELISYQLN
ncbi:MAG: hypothetical protein LBJ17_08250 [Dysgonamonadaceae bacterium]|jgi:hypothetical protein|nr:hypothetical protein [Dysgonamonadaceae bacterium]